MIRKKLKLEELNRVDVEEFKNQAKFPIVLVADNIRSAMNIGSLFRTSDAFAIEKLILTGISARPPHKEITKTAIGATSSVEWEYVPDILDGLKKYKSMGYEIIAIEQTNDAATLHSYDVCTEGKYVLVVGNEVRGVSDEIIAIADTCLELQQYGTKHSLNVSVCTGIVLWAFIHKIRG